MIFSCFGFVLSIVKKATNLEQSILSRKKCFEQTKQPVKMVLRFAQQQKIQLSEMCEPYFFMRNPLAKISARSISIKFWTTTTQRIHWFSRLRKPFLRIFLDCLKLVKNLAFLKTKRTKKFRLSISVSAWRLSYNVLRIGAVAFLLA